MEEGKFPREMGVNFTNELFMDIIASENLVIKYLNPLQDHCHKLIYDINFIIIQCYRPGRVSAIIIY